MEQLRKDGSIVTRSERATTVTVQLPAKWMAGMFADWVIDAFTEHVLANEGQRLLVQNTDDELNVVFVREGQTQEPPLGKIDISRRFNDP